MNVIAESNRQFVREMKNIVRNGDHYELQNNFFIDEDGNGKLHVIYGEQTSNCLLCSRYVPCGDSQPSGYCDVLTALMGDREYIGLRYVVDGVECPDCGHVVQCDAFDEVKPLNIIRSFDDMVTFIERTYNFFPCVEMFEEYFGFVLLYDEETGEILESVRDYANRGGAFEKIPTQFPAVIRFDISTECPLEWICLTEDVQ